MHDRPVSQDSQIGVTTIRLQTTHQPIQIDARTLDQLQHLPGMEQHRTADLVATIGPDRLADNLGLGLSALARRPDQIAHEYQAIEQNTFQLPALT